MAVLGILSVTLEAPDLTARSPILHARWSHRCPQPYPRIAQVRRPEAPFPGAVRGREGKTSPSHHAASRGARRHRRAGGSRGRCRDRGAGGLRVPRSVGEGPPRDIATPDKAPCRSSARGGAAVHHKRAGPPSASPAIGDIADRFLRAGEAHPIGSRAGFLSRRPSERRVRGGCPGICAVRHPGIGRPPTRGSTIGHRFMTALRRE